jgi:hypothetical protein
VSRLGGGAHCGSEPESEDVMDRVPADAKLETRAQDLESESVAGPGLGTGLGWRMRTESR